MLFLEEGVPFLVYTDKGLGVALNSRFLLAFLIFPDPILSILGPPTPSSVVSSVFPTTSPPFFFLPPEILPGDQQVRSSWPSPFPNLPWSSGTLAGSPYSPCACRFHSVLCDFPGLCFEDRNECNLVLLRNLPAPGWGWEVGGEAGAGRRRHRHHCAQSCPESSGWSGQALQGSWTLELDWMLELDAGGASWI